MRNEEQLATFSSSISNLPTSDFKLVKSAFLPDFEGSAAFSTSDIVA